MDRYYLGTCDERNVYSFIQNLLGHKGEFCIDFSMHPFLIPFAVLSLLIRIRNLRNSGNTIYVSNYQKFGYLLRVDFFKQGKIEIKEDFLRHPPAGRFIPITSIDNTYSTTQIENVASFFAPNEAELDDPNKTGVYDYICYAFSELTNNVTQHSQGAGLYFAQKYNNANILRFAIADDGIGIRNSLINTPFIKDTDLLSIKEAIKPKISGRAWKFPTSDSPNAGVGLSLLVEMTKITKGDFFILSGNGLCSSRGDFEFDDSIHGTICGFTFPLSILQQQGFEKTLTDAKINLHLVSQKDNARFEDVFI